MSKERTVAPMGGFFKFTTIGQQVAGVVKRYGNSDNGPFIVFEPVLVRNARGEQMHSFASAAVGLTTDLKLKVSQTDVGKCLALTFTDTEPTKKDSNKKLFRVEELDRGELIDLARAADNSERQNVYSRSAETEGDIVAADNDDDLPF